MATAADGEAALAAFGAVDPAIVVLDLMLPVRDGLEACRELRRGSDVPILMLTARADDVDKIIGLELGADDYLTKPFNARELIARLRAILRRSERAPGGRTRPATNATLGPAGRPLAPTAPRRITTSWNTAAFRGLGSLAFVSHGLLYVMRSGAVTQITHTGTAANPEWSHDGRWLAYVRTSGAPHAQGGRLWLARADGSDAHAVSGPAGRAWLSPSGTSYAWSPAADVLAATPLPSPGAGGLYLVPPSGAPAPLAFASREVGSPVWSPDGATVAVSVTAPKTRADTLETVAVRTGAQRPGTAHPR